MHPNVIYQYADYIYNKANQSTDVGYLQNCLNCLINLRDRIRSLNISHAADDRLTARLHNITNRIVNINERGVENQEAEQH